MKALVAPLSFVLVGLLMVCVLDRLRLKRWTAVVFTLSWSFLYAFSTPLMTSLILFSLGKGDATEVSGRCPDYVVIPAGGYIHGASAGYDVLHHFTSLRVAGAAELYGACEDTLFVMTGSSAKMRTKEHQANSWRNLLSVGVSIPKGSFSSPSL